MSSKFGILMLIFQKKKKNVTSKNLFLPLLHIKKTSVGAFFGFGELSKCGGFYEYEKHSGRI